MIKELLEDNHGGLSTSRLIALVPVMVVAFGWFLVVIARAATAFGGGTCFDLPTIPLEVSGFALGCAGLKVVQRATGEKLDTPQ